MLVQDRCTVCAKRTIGPKIVLDALDGILGDEAQVVTHFGLFGGSANLDARWVQGLRRTYHKLRKLFWTHPVELQGDVDHVESHSVHLEMVLVLVQDRRTS